MIWRTSAGRTKRVSSFPPAGREGLALTGAAGTGQQSQRRSLLWFLLTGERSCSRDGFDRQLRALRGSIVVAALVVVCARCTLGLGLSSSLVVLLSSHLVLCSRNHNGEKMFTGSWYES